MIIMDKFQKRLSKSCGSMENALVIGSGINNLEKIINIFKNVFVFSKTSPQIKAKNLIYRENFNHISQITEISAVIFDLDYVKYLEDTAVVWTKWKSTIIIEGDIPIGRDLSTSLYKNHYECTSIQGFFHVWEPTK